MQWLRKSREASLNRRKCVLFHSPEMKSVAEEMLSKEDVSEYISLGSINWDTFEDGFPNIFINHVEMIRGRDVVFLASFLKHDLLLAQLAVLFALPRYLAKSLVLVLPYFPTGTMERVDSEGQIATAHTFARLLSSIPPTQKGPVKLVIYDIHALQERFYFGDNTIPLLVSAIPLFVEQLKTIHKDEDLAIAFPDDGAHKRFGDKFKDYETIICQKVRDGDRRIVTIKEGNPAGKHVFIVDDLVKTGGTLIQCQEALLERGASEVSAYVTHPVFPLESWKRFSEPKGRPFKVFYITNSCTEMAEFLRDKAPFQVLSLASSIVDCILRY